MHDRDQSWADYGDNGQAIVFHLYTDRIDQLIATTNLTNEVVWHLSDRLSTVFHVANNETILESFSFNAFGYLNNASSLQIPERYAFTGRDLTLTSGFYYYRQRYYDASTARFTHKILLASLARI